MDTKEQNSDLIEKSKKIEKKMLQINWMSVGYRIFHHCSNGISSLLHISRMVGRTASYI